MKINNSIKELFVWDDFVRHWRHLIMYSSGDGRYMINGLYLKQINGENNEDK